ncbi:MAG: patatin-like phospholipase family protein [Baekduia sp.]
MGDVVDIKGRGKEPQRAAATPQRRRRKPRGRSKTALVLGGGGITGGVYEIGALRALDLLSVNHTINQFDVYVGTSAGSAVAAMASNGVTPEEMMRVVHGVGPSPFPDMDLDLMLRPNLIEFVRKSVALPWRAVQVARELAPRIGQVSLMDIAVGMAEALPSGLYSGSGIEEYIRLVLSDPDRTDDFRSLENELYIVATDLDTCERVVFGEPDWQDVPISRAVRASTGLPMVYKPTRVGDRELVDGGLVSTTNLDVAVNAGAKLIVVVNPLVPYHNDFVGQISTLLGSRARRVSDMGLPQIGYQSFKMMAHQRLHMQARYWQEKYPGVDIVLIEPDVDDELMFQTSIMNYTKRLDIARHGFGSVTYKLAEDYEHYKEIFERHGVKISADRVRDVVRTVAAQETKQRAWERILEQTTGTLLRQVGRGQGTGRAGA